ncbi:MAG: 30S ribosomal protein S6--L-glutamate ligase [Flavobacteriales bacterium CG_4_10_14_0_2_um_filter_32_8]|nr:MAG: 30S ribosomal protein S6--L-glutamate ligase [Flavobacteriales bacterium CG_4_10_14_0_2_um_filter_32_8]PJB15273.1 MAG: 30S ribosomal protein S6--L-glutamate ligase [Flavobacteriales bacterium CG_4_9_14_3_um_filter_32_8]
MITNKKLKIVILSRNADLYSTKRLVEAAEQRGHEAMVIDHAKCSVLMEKSKPAIMYNGEFLHKTDAIIPRIGASVTFYGTAIVRQFEMMNVFSTSESQAITRSRDKLRSLQLLSREGLGIPKTVFAKHPKNLDVEGLIENVGGAPLIIKILEGTQGLGVVLADTTNSAKSMIEAFSGIKTNILIQEFIKESRGVDIRAFVVNGEVVGAMERRGKEGEFRSNLHRGGKGTIIQLTRKETNTALRAAKAHGLSIAGVDMLRSSRGPLILEVNSSPGLQGIEGATQVDIAGKIITFIEQNVTKRIKRNLHIK